MPGLWHRPDWRGRQTLVPGVADGHAPLAIPAGCLGGRFSGPAGKEATSILCRAWRYPTAAEGVTEMTACFESSGFSGDCATCFASKLIGVPTGAMPGRWAAPVAFTVRPYAPEIW
jgi:hypothetical protein